MSKLDTLLWGIWFGIGMILIDYFFIPGGFYG